ncbi:hypothetical protein I7I51_00597 [Histoplasma capsulatum]|uniref:Uncharacterized protein n=1 Tax=Ajellomyces capsulatus TaxID=5037 RepID=A0A8A1MC75_AJECA|nr:hypothetical protein I7I51_00597 [Histoplasma capsulatum]
MSFRVVLENSNLGRHRLCIFHLPPRIRAELVELMPAELATTRLAIQMISFSYKGMKVVTIPGEKPAGFGSLTWLFSLWKLALFRLNSHSRMTNATKLTEIGAVFIRKRMLEHMIEAVLQLLPHDATKCVIHPRKCSNYK